LYFIPNPIAPIDDASSGGEQAADDRDPASASGGHDGSSHAAAQGLAVDAPSQPAD